MSFLKKLRDTFYITGRTSSMRTTTSEAPYVISSTFENPSFRPGDDYGDQIIDQDQSHGSVWMNVSTASEPANSDGSLSDSLLHGEDKHDTETSSQAEENIYNTDNTESLNSFGSASSLQRIFRKGKPPRDISRQGFQDNYVARKGYGNGSHHRNQNFGNESYDSNGEDLVPRSRRQGNNYRIGEDGERPGSSGSKHNHNVVDDGERPGSSGAKPDLSKSLRDVIRQQRRPNVVHDSGADTTNNKTYQEHENEKIQRVPTLMRVCIFCFILLLCAAGIAVLIHFIRNSEDVTTDRATCVTNSANFGQNIIIACSTTVKTVSNISIFKNPSKNATALEIILTRQNPERDGWNMSYTSQIDTTNITLTGPPANCSSGGEYNITITNNSTKKLLLSRITLEVTGNLTINWSNSNCSNVTCKSLGQCERGFELQMYSPNFDFQSNFQSTCNKNCSEIYGCTARCDGTIFPVIQNFTVTCTLYDFLNKKEILTKNVTRCT